MLIDSPIADLRGIQVEQEEDCLVLKGRVRTFYAKQMAQETVRRAATKMRIVNYVRVE